MWLSYRTHTTPPQKKLQTAPTKASTEKEAHSEVLHVCMNETDNWAYSVFYRIIITMRTKAVRKELLTMQILHP